MLTTDWASCTLSTSGSFKTVFPDLQRHALNWVHQEALYGDVVTNLFRVESLALFSWTKLFKSWAVCVLTKSLQIFPDLFKQASSFPGRIANVKIK